MLFAAFILSVLHLEAGAISLEVEPEDFSAIFGMSVSLQCVVSDWASGSVLWYFQTGKQYISRDRTVYRRWSESDRFSVTGDAQAGEYTLHISNVTAEDEGLYACLLFEDGVFSESSRDAFLEVFPVPNHSFPECSIIPDVVSGGTGPGDWVVARCVAQGGTRMSRLDWVKDFEILPGTFSEGASPKALYEFRLTEIHNGAVFSCIETNPGWQHERSCSIMPFYYKTNVTTSLDKTTYSIGDNVTVKCAVEALPMYGLNYTWLLNGDIISRHYADDYRLPIALSNDYSELTLHSLNGSLNNSVIECNVINILELEGKASLSLKLQKEEVFAKLVPMDNDNDDVSNRLILAVILGVVIPCLLFIIILLVVLSYRRRRAGILHLLKERRISLRYTVQQRYVDIKETAVKPSDDVGSLHSVLICSTPREAIQEHTRELRRISSAREHPTDRDGYLQPDVAVVKPRGRSRPTISAPISVVIPEFTVELRDLDTVISHKDALTIDEDYVSDADTEWDL